MRSSARRSSGWKTTTSANSPTTAPVSRIWVSSSSCEEPGREVDDEQDRHADDEAHGTRPTDEAEQPVDQERRDPDVQEGLAREPDPGSTRGAAACPGSVPRELRRTAAGWPRGRASASGAGAQGVVAQPLRREAVDVRLAPACRRSARSGGAGARSSRSPAPVQPRSSWRFAIARWTCGSPGAVVSSCRQTSSAASRRPAARWTVAAEQHPVPRAVAVSPAAMSSAASASSASGSGGGPSIGAGGGDGRSTGGHAALASGPARDRACVAHVDPARLRPELGDPRGKGARRGSATSWTARARDRSRLRRRAASATGSAAGSSARLGSGSIAGRLLARSARRSRRTERRLRRVPPRRARRSASASRADGGLELRGTPGGLRRLGRAPGDVQDERQALEVVAAPDRRPRSSRARARARSVASSSGRNPEGVGRTPPRPPPSDRGGGGPCPGSRSAGRARARAARRARYASSAASRSPASAARCPRRSAALYCSKSESVTRGSLPRQETRAAPARGTAR